MESSKAFRLQLRMQNMQQLSTRKFPRVKHDYKYAIQSVREVTKEEYFKQKEINKEDPYLMSKSKYEQNLNCDNLSVFPMNDIIEKTRKKHPPRYKKGRKRFNDELLEYEMESMLQ